jgi:glycosyltransferase involved in cell wall biosynthesis
MQIGVIWAQYGPYHFARVSVLRQLALPARVHAIELADRTSYYQWDRSTHAKEVTTLYPGVQAEELTFREVFLRARKTFAELNLEVCFLPSYSPRPSLAALLAAKSLGIRTVMMNDSHAGTARARGLAAVLKRGLVGLFDAALVAGIPHKRYFVGLGLPQDSVLTGYDAVDNDYFAKRAVEVRGQSSGFSCHYELPKHYFLSLGRFVAKKNLNTLIRAYRLFLDTSAERKTDLVMVGAGEEEAKLRCLCTALNLPVYDHDPGRNARRLLDFAPRAPGIHFYGFRQIEENPVFYALADGFILPSLWEEWGLVVNEAMASSLPVVVSETAGCAEDLLEAGPPEESLSPSVRSLADKYALGTRVRRNGFVFDPNSCEELSRVMLCLEESLEVRAAMGSCSRQLVQKFSCENFARNAIRAAEAALRRGRGPARECSLEIAVGGGN